MIMTGYIKQTQLRHQKASSHVLQKPFENISSNHMLTIKLSQGIAFDSALIYDIVFMYYWFNWFISGWYSFLKEFANQRLALAYHLNDYYKLWNDFDPRHSVSVESME